MGGASEPYAIADDKCVLFNIAHTYLAPNMTDEHAPQKSTFINTKHNLTKCVLYRV